eukprot:CAMPEP_0184017544 /NCGR_PEP_ID=MMETSP0954-20121128/7600_1 /TAXON_ID=627963 /ORGANISM="Aplanochytrium sp, Strain PBS07" /LENGTH=289 /DNA_ID=CAMNT_0026298801 /DNA_START=333 /DNA_END=1199 /DNA_ORIENTATION=-
MKNLKRKMSRGTVLTKKSISNSIPAKPASPPKLTIGYSTRTGKGHPNEDRVSSQSNLNELVSGYVGLFDGHGGGDCSEYMSRVMSQHVTENFSSEEAWEKGEDVFRDMFHHLDEEYCEKAKQNDDTSGTCATVVVVKGDEAIVANIGDCRAVVVKEGDKKAKSVTKDHRADTPDEERRISEAGGKVQNGRILNLSPSRVFGDIDVKSLVGANVVIPTPDVDRVKLNGSKGFMIVASDGLWDVVSNQTAADIVKKSLKSKGDADLAAHLLVEKAVKQRSLDDITVAVLVW